MRNKRAEAAKVVEDEAARIAASSTPPPLPLEQYAGRYKDVWRGEAEVREVGGKLILKFSRTQGLKGALTPYRGNTFIVRWSDRSLNADAYVRCSQAFGEGIDGMTLKAISPATDFSVDFPDLEFKREQPSTQR